MKRSGGAKRDLNALEKRRLQGACLLRLGLSQSAISRELGVSRQTVSRWAKSVARNGAQGLYKADRVGRKPRLNDAALRELRQLLPTSSVERRRSKWTCAMVARLIHTRFGVLYHPGHIWRLLKGLGWSFRASV